MGDTDGKRDCAEMSDGKRGSPASGNGDREDPVAFRAGKRTETSFCPESFGDYEDISRDKSAELKRPDACAKVYPTVFKWTGGGKEVYVCGSFSDWKPIPMVRSQHEIKDENDEIKVHEEFNAILALPVGEYQYKFQVDGQWIHNPEEPAVDNEFGTKNNIIAVKVSDYLRFEALDNVGYELEKGSSPPGSYSQSIPWYTRQQGKEEMPKILPAYLLEVVLNNEILMPSCEPIEHSEPYRAMLELVYKPEEPEVDGCVSVGFIYSYQEKYVTSIYYKPRQGPCE